MLNRLSRCLAVCSSAALVACANDQPPADQAAAAPSATEQTAANQPAPLTQQDIDAFSNRADEAIRNADTAAANDFYTDDAVMISAKGKVEGGPALAAFWKDAMAAGRGKSLQAETVKFGASGDLAWALSRFTGGVTAPSGYTLRVFQRQPDGSIRTVVQLSIPDMPAQQ